MCATLLAWHIKPMLSFVIILAGYNRWCQTQACLHTEVRMQFVYCRTLYKKNCHVLFTKGCNMGGRGVTLHQLGYEQHILIILNVLLFMFIHTSWLRGIFSIVQIKNKILSWYIAENKTWLARNYDFLVHCVVKRQGHWVHRHLDCENDQNNTRLW